MDRIWKEDVRGTEHGRGFGDEAGEARLSQQERRETEYMGWWERKSKKGH